MSKRPMPDWSKVRFIKGEYFDVNDVWCSRCGAMPGQRCVVTRGPRTELSRNGVRTPREAFETEVYQHSPRFALASLVRERLAGRPHYEQDWFPNPWFRREGQHYLVLRTFPPRRKVG